MSESESAWCTSINESCDKSRDESQLVLSAHDKKLFRQGEEDEAAAAEMRSHLQM